MSHTSREKLDLVNRTKKVVGQLDGVLRARNDDEQCADVLQRLSAVRGSINSLMAELMEDHIRNHMPRNSKSSEEAADDVIQIVRTYLKSIALCLVSCCILVAHLRCRHSHSSTVE